MVNEWKIIPFVEICEHSAFGPRFSGDLYTSDGNVATLRTTDINEDGCISYKTMPFAYVDVKKFNQHFLEKEDLVITRSGRIGTAALFKGFQIPVLPGAFLIRFRLRRNMAEPKFYKYFFNSTTGQELLFSVASGSVQLNLNITSVHKLNIPLPPLPEQKAIADILSSLDDKIELNNQMNKTLEQMARAIFKQWFVDFEFPVAFPLPVGEGGPLAVGEGATYKSSGGSMIDSELGMIPEGWRVGDIDDISLLKNGKSSPERNEHETIPVYGSNGIIGYSEKYNSEENTIVVGRVGSYCGSLYYSLNKCWVTDNAIICKAKEINYSKFLYYTLQNLKLNDKSAGSGQPLLNQGIIGSLKILIPPYNVSEKFENIVKSFFEKVEYNDKQSQTLSSLRNTLLPKLMSGELRVPPEKVREYENA